MWVTLNLHENLITLINQLEEYYLGYCKVNERLQETMRNHRPFINAIELFLCILGIRKTFRIFNRIPLIIHWILTQIATLFPFHSVSLISFSSLARYDIQYQLFTVKLYIIYKLCIRKRKAFKKWTLKIWYHQRGYPFSLRWTKRVFFLLLLFLTHYKRHRTKLFTPHHILPNISMVASSIPSYVRYEEANKSGVAG